MKIVVVRGKNLASLAGHFEVDFSAPPLDRAGLISITGPTGAGKTTLLDAMCLALFDRTPRFANRGGVVIGAGRDEPGLRATDVRGILRHGAVEGWAEVDFLGVDEHLWRARWEVRRARGRVDGRIQAQQMQLIDAVSGRVIAADRKGDTLAAIEQRLGLDFDQFRRSVLLAQGEFAAFLEASGNERAELLERMTGTWLYRELGRGAFERAKHAERKREDLERERARLQILDASERERLEAAVELERVEQAKLERERVELEAAKRWYATEDALAAALAEARAALEDRAGAERGRALEGREQLLAEVERVAAVRERQAAVTRSLRERDAGREELAWFRNELPLIEAQRDDLSKALTGHEQRLLAARERRRRLGPELDRARALDTKLEATRDERERVAAKREAAARAVELAATKLEHLDAGLAAAEANYARAQAWLDAHAALEPLVGDWLHYRSLLQQQQRGLDATAKARARIELLEPRQLRASEQFESATHERNLARRRRGQARGRLQKIERELDERPALAELRHRQVDLDVCRERLAQLRALSEHFTRAASDVDTLERERRDQQVERDHRGREVVRVEAELEAAERGFDEARRGLRQLEAMRDLAEHRAELRPGEACPVCGASDHPAASADAPADAIVAAQRERVAALLRTRDDLQREQGDHQGREELAVHRLATIADRLRVLAGHQAELQEQWVEVQAEGPLLPSTRAEDEDDHEDEDEEPDEDSEASAQLSLLGAPARAGQRPVPERLDDVAVGPALWTVHDTLDQRARALAEAREAVESLLDDQRKRRANLDEAEGRLERARERVDEHVKVRDDLSRELDELRSQLESLDGDIAERWTELDDAIPAALAHFDPPLAGFEQHEHEEDHLAALRRGFADHAGELIAALARAKDSYGKQRKQCEQSREGLRELATGRSQLASAHAARIEGLVSLDEELETLDANLRAGRAERAGLLEGRAVAALVRELEGSVEVAERDRDATKDRHAKAEREVQAQRTRIEALVEKVGALEARRAEAAASLEAARVETGLERERIEVLLAREELWAEGWVVETRALVDEARAELERLRAVVAERERVAAAHREQDLPRLDSDSDSVAEALAALDGRADRLRRALFELEHPLRRDAEDRQLAAALEPQLGTARRGARVWGRLRDAIGSASGDKFQKFAQSLTLELLLAQANAQLRELKPRYALSRVPKFDLELQLIDHDLGDEVRSIRGLSGGEKFLVSLALALALAGLSSEDCRIESLFIDEGFGTLDAQSLDIAVSTLDALQAEGRQIGVISHVPGLAERVGVEIRVEPVSSGRSRVRVVGPGGVGAAERHR